MSKSDEFELSSGLPWADTIVEITAAVFGYNPNIGGGTTLCANLTGRNEDGDESEQSFTIGDGWEAVDGGARIQPDNGAENKKISKNSNYGKLIADAVACMPGDTRQEKAENMPFDSAKEIAGWVGTRWGTATEQVPRMEFGTGKQKVDKDGNLLTRDAIRFVSFEGKTETSAPAKASSGKSSSSSSSKSSGGLPAGVSQELADQLTELAKSSDDFDAFMEAALDLDGVEGNAAATKLVTNGKPDGFYQQAVKG